ncbi:MAG TPA: hypothetical protein VIJ42_05590 [Stellaceae bacterium]
MVTDDCGREIALTGYVKTRMIGGGRLFLIGIALGAGLCAGFGPQLPLLDMSLQSAAAAEPPKAETMPHRWLVLRNALLDTSVTGASRDDQRVAVVALHGKWLALRDALQDRTHLN